MENRIELTQDPKQVANWIAFYLKGRDQTLCRISIEGTFPGEIQSTAELLAADHNLAISDIQVCYE